MIRIIQNPMEKNAEHAMENESIWRFKRDCNVVA